MASVSVPRCRVGRYVAGARCGLSSGESGRGRLQALEAAAQLPVSDGGIIGVQLYLGIVRIMPDHLRAERGGSDLAFLPELERVPQRVRDLAALVGVGAALECGLQR